MAINYVALKTARNASRRSKRNTFHPKLNFNKFNSMGLSIISKTKVLHHKFISHKEWFSKSKAKQFTANQYIITDLRIY